MSHPPLKSLCAIAASFLVVNAIQVELAPSAPGLRLSLAAALAKSSGGRSGGGSFKSPSRSSPSQPSSPSRPSNPGNNPGYNNNPGYSGPVVVPVPVGGGYSAPGSSYGNQPQSTSSSEASTGDVVLGFIILGAGAAILILILYFIIKAIRNNTGTTKRDQEINNEIVTISKIQVALLSQARSLQAELTQLTLDADTDDAESWKPLVQESALALLRTPENWSHVLASSQTLKKREQAEELFSKLSIAERSKFSVETLSNVGGRVSQRDLKLDPEKDPASYIVVTLLIGTAHDHPLFSEIRTQEALKEILEKLASVPEDYLLVFEVLWSPQDQADSLTYDELLTEYTEMVQI